LATAQVFAQVDHLLELALRVVLEVRQLGRRHLLRLLPPLDHQVVRQHDQPVADVDAQQHEAHEADDACQRHHDLRHDRQLE
jgi:hypothetical protein